MSDTMIADMQKSLTGATTAVDRIIAERDGLRAENAKLRSAIERFKATAKGESDDSYLKMCRASERNECKGEIYKLANGKFTVAELDAHRLSARLRGQHTGLIRSIELIQEAIETATTE